MGFESIRRVPLMALASKVYEFVMDHTVELLEIEVEEMGHDGTSRKEIKGVAAVVLFLGILLADHSVVALEVVEGEVVALCGHNCVKK